MKNIVILLMPLFLITACKSFKHKEESRKISFEIHQGTEFLITAFNLAVEEEISDEYKPCETAYTKRIAEHFEPFKKHPFIKYIYDEVYSGTDFASVGLLITDFETMTLNPNIETDLIKSKIYSDDIEKFKKLALSFYKESKFKSFFNQNKAYYNTATAHIQKQVEKDSLFNQIKDYYQDSRAGLEFKAFVELTNNNESQAVDFYDNYNPNVRAITLGNFCELSTKSTPQNEILDLNSYQTILCHEISHLYTTSVFLDKYIGNINDFKPLFDKKISEAQLKDQVDHYIIFPLQGIFMKKLYNNMEMDDIFRNKVKDVRRDIYLHLSKYDPKGTMSFEKYYKECIELIRDSAKEKNISNMVLSK
ncbi:DUF4932 domain-containing protein [Ancylomarina sp. DW003]|nr:DUF4932 domain-containing protein [Ancylomarina sp. DW003]MDE5422559.1 DUF4932 domain-containing protein [Ancylomarina sp. DW003]